MPEERLTGEAIPLEEWLARVHDSVGPGAGPALTADEQTALLDLARVAAHRSERITAPLTTFLAGVAYGALPAEERAPALRRLLELLES
jgi:hypothetical protein